MIARIREPKSAPATLPRPPVMLTPPMTQAAMTSISLILAIIAKALPLIGIEAIAQNTVKGIIILVVIVLNVITQRMMDKNNLKGREM